ncbi:MAG: AEC family transporter [Lachnospiraceae bacterium]|nr:AEC family transporter [Lachnospiraceae bacterium]
MESSLIVLQQMAVIAILVGIGFFLQKRSVLGEKGDKILSKIVVDICNPALVVSTILSGNISVTHQDFLRGLVIGAALYASFCLLGLIIPRILRLPKDERRFYNLMTIYTNVGFLGIPVAKAVLPEDAIVYVIICNVAYSVLFYTHGILVISGAKEKIKPVMMLNPGVLMSLLALVIFWFDLSFPPILENSFNYIGNPTVFLSMVLLGTAVAKSDLIRDIKDARLWIFILIRMILVPLMVVFVLRMLGAPDVMVKTFCLMSAVPVGNLPLIQAQKTGQRTDILSKGIIVTTVFSFISITLFMTLI